MMRASMQGRDPHRAQRSARPRRPRAARTLSFGQVLVKIHYSGICGAQINEIEGAKGPDRVSAAPARPRRIRHGARHRPRRPQRPARRSRRPALAARRRAAVRHPAYHWNGTARERRMGDDLQRSRGRVGEPRHGDSRRLRPPDRAVVRLRGDDGDGRGQPRRGGADRPVGGGVRCRRRRRQHRPVGRMVSAHPDCRASTSSIRSSNGPSRFGATHMYQFEDGRGPGGRDSRQSSAAAAPTSWSTRPAARA